MKTHIEKGIIADFILKTINLKFFIYKLLDIKYIKNKNKRKRRNVLYI